MNRKQWKKLNIDSRDAQTIVDEITDLSEQYETGWTPDPENPDIGTAIAKIYAGNMEENIDRVNHILDRYHTEFVNMLDISLLPAKPASTIVVMDMIAGTLPGTAVPKGTKLLAGTGEEPYIFETDHSLYVSSSRLVSAFMADAEEGSIVPLLGHFSRPLLPGETVRQQTIFANQDDLEDEEDVEVVEDTEEDAPSVSELVIEEIRPFTLFGEVEGIEQNAVVFCHPTVFDTGRNDIFVRVEGNQLLVKDIASGAYTFCYTDPEEGLKPIDHVKLLPDQNTFVLNKDSETSFTQLILKAKKPPVTSKKVRRICFSSRGEEMPAEAVNSGATDYDRDNFLPFTDTLSLYSECYIGHDRYFGKAGARITMTFTLLFEEHRISLTEAEEFGELKIIKRRPNAAQKEIFADCYAQEIAIEYFNGTGWKKLPLMEEPRMMFYEQKARRVTLSFICPDDWMETESGSYSGRSVRIQLLKSDNCYVRPSVHHYPIMKNLRIQYSYEDHFVDAQTACIYYGTKSYDLTNVLKNEKGYTVFQKSEYNEDSLYLGFSRRIENGPASILFQLQDDIRFVGIRCRFEYLGHEGWRQMKVLDYTQEFTHSGVVMFMPPADMKREELEGRACYWIRVVRMRKESEDELRELLPKLENIILNAVQVSNIETLPQESVYIDEVTPGIRFALGASNVLDADVWVNEFGRYSRDVMLEMAEKDSDRVQIEYDTQGQITAFYTLWDETERFETSMNPRVYIIDRLQNELIFGDGVHTYVPQVIDDTAVRFTVRCCNGQAGNVPAGSITEAMGNLTYIGNINNPVKAYGGSNIETIENALQRGAGILSSRNRLVSMDDYCREIMSYSDTIDQVAGVVGTTIEGKTDASQITFLLLMKDYEEGSYSFHRLMSGLKEELLSHCELTVTPDKLHIQEPVFVDISVGVWVNVVSIDDSFEIQNILRECLEEYLSPLGYGTGKGWKIGTIPKKPQILMRLNVLKSRAIVKKSVMIAHYTDGTGEHEVDLADIKVTPFMVPRNGTHEVHIIY